MRKKEALIIKHNFQEIQIEVLEITIADILVMLFSAKNDDEFNASFVANYFETNIGFFINSSIHISKMSANAIELISNSFLNVNKEYFNPESEQTNKRKIASKLKRYVKHEKADLISIVNSLIQMGHIEAINYGWSFFDAILEDLKRKSN